MRASDPPPAMVEARREFTNAHQHAEGGPTTKKAGATLTRSPMKTDRTHTRWPVYAYLRGRGVLPPRPHDVRHRVSRAETVAGRARSTESSQRVPDMSAE
ncbi:hypothetical protein KM043_018396 [Ampulex compressa]|nr:hypothetical protein KM043_018396 [Ampulex compressa]